jgi:hypothetical protein
VLGSIAWPTHGCAGPTDMKIAPTEPRAVAFWHHSGGLKLFGPGRMKRAPAEADAPISREKLRRNLSDQSCDQQQDNRA